jgi:hypothetical protein
MATTVTIATLILDLEEQKAEVKGDKGMTLEAKVKLTNAIIDRQLRAAMLDLAYRKSAARLPESGIGLTAMLAAPNGKTAPPSTSPVN